MNKQTSSKRVYSSGEQAILKAAETLFSEHGFDAVSMSAIARLANTSKPNIYHHFENKNALYLAVMKAAVHRTSVLLDALEEDSGSFSEHLSDFAAGQLNNLLSHESTSQLLLREALFGGTQRGQEITKHAFAEVFARLVDMVHDGQQTGEFRDEIDPALAAFMVVASNMFFLQATPTLKHLPDIHFADDAGMYNKGVMDILLNGIIGKGGEKQ